MIKFPPKRVSHLASSPGPSGGWGWGGGRGLGTRLSATVHTVDHLLFHVYLSSLGHTVTENDDDLSAETLVRYVYMKILGCIRAHLCSAMCALNHVQYVVNWKCRAA